MRYLHFVCPQENLCTITLSSWNMAVNSSDLVSQDLNECLGRTTSIADITSACLANWFPESEVIEVCFKLPLGDFSCSTDGLNVSLDVPVFFLFFYFLFIHFCPGTMTTHAESINSDLQRGLERRL